jgi:hypothetical protein
MEAGSQRPRQSSHATFLFYDAGNENPATVAMLKISQRWLIMPAPFRKGVPKNGKERMNRRAARARRQWEQRRPQLFDEAAESIREEERRQIHIDRRRSKRREHEAEHDAEKKNAEHETERKNKDGADTRTRDANRLFRAVKMIAYDSVREQKKSQRKNN